MSTAIANSLTGIAVFVSARMTSYSEVELSRAERAKSGRLESQFRSGLAQRTPDGR